MTDRVAELDSRAPQLFQSAAHHEAKRRRDGRLSEGFASHPEEGRGDCVSGVTVVWKGLHTLHSGYLASSLPRHESHHRRNAVLAYSIGAWIPVSSEAATCGLLAISTKLSYEIVARNQVISGLSAFHSALPKSTGIQTWHHASPPGRWRHFLSRREPPRARPPSLLQSPPRRIATLGRHTRPLLALAPCLHGRQTRPTALDSHPCALKHIVVESRSSDWPVALLPLLRLGICFGQGSVRRPGRQEGLVRLGHQEGLLPSLSPPSPLLQAEADGDDSSQRSGIPTRTRGKGRTSGSWRSRRRTMYALPF